MLKFDGQACVACMISDEAAKSLSLEEARRRAEDVARKHFPDCFLVMQNVVDLPYKRLSSQEKITRDIVIQAIENDRYPALILFGDVQTEFGVMAEMIARRVGMKVILVGFGEGTFNRRCRAWFKDKPKTGTALAVRQAGN